MCVEGMFSEIMVRDSKFCTCVIRSRLCVNKYQSAIDFYCHSFTDSSPWVCHLLATAVARTLVPLRAACLAQHWINHRSAALVCGFSEDHHVLPRQKIQRIGPLQPKHAHFFDNLLLGHFV